MAEEGQIERDSKKSRVEESKESRVEEVIKSVNGTYRLAGDAVRQLLSDSPSLNDRDVMRIMAAYLIRFNDDLLISEYDLYRLDYQPWNQLAGNNYGHATDFYKKYVAPRASFVDPNILDLFCTRFGIKSSKDYVLTETEIDDLVRRIHSNKVCVMTGAGVTAQICEQTEISNAVTSWTRLLDILLRAILMDNLLALNRVHDTVVFPDSLPHLMSYACKNDVTHIAELEDRRFDGIKKILTTYRTAEEGLKGVLLKELTQLIPNHGVMGYTHLIYMLFSQVKYRSDFTNKISSDSLADALRSLHVPIATTNYDTVLDDAMHRTYVNYIDINAAHLASSEKYLYHVHGVWHSPEGFVLSSNEYLEHAQAFETAMDALLNSENGKKSMLLVGVGEGLFDMHFLAYLKKYPATIHYILLRHANVDNYNAKLNQEGVTNVRIIDYGNKYKELAPYIWKLGVQAGFTNMQMQLQKYDFAGATLTDLEKYETVDGVNVTTTPPHTDIASNMLLLRSTSKGDTYTKWIPI